MVKDRKARREGEVTVMALANLYAALVDTMRAVGLPHGMIHAFLDELERLNAITNSGRLGAILDEMVEVVRATVPSND